MTSEAQAGQAAKAEAAMERLSGLFFAAVEESAEAMLITDAQGIITYVNPAFSRMTGYSREEVLGQTPRFLKSGEHEPAFYEGLWQTILKGETWHGEIVNRRKDGSFYNAELNIAPVRAPGGEVTHFIAGKQDVTMRRELEQQLRWAGSVEAVGRLAGGVVHELNNLLAIISGYGELLQQRVKPEGQAALGEILKAGERAAALTRQLLAFSRGQVLAPQVLDLNSIVTDLAKMLRLLIGDGIELDIVQLPGLGRVKADQGQMEGIIMNLAVNARDAMPQGGKITIAIANVYLAEAYSRAHIGASPGPHVMLSVGYSGRSTEPEPEEKLSKNPPTPTPTTTSKGSGLGLATVFGVIRQNGGHIWVHSERGRGTAFKVYLPRIEEAAPESAPSESSQP